jgi:hypothetical protein
MRKCPFCGEEVIFRDPYISQFGDDGTWNFNHYCKHKPNKLGVVITIYGDSEEEVISKWEGACCAEEQTSESL